MNLREIIEFIPKQNLNDLDHTIVCKIHNEFNFSSNYSFFSDKIILRFRSNAILTPLEYATGNIPFEIKFRLEITKQNTILYNLYFEKNYIFENHIFDETLFALEYGREDLKLFERDMEFYYG